MRFGSDSRSEISNVRRKGRFGVTAIFIIILFLLAGFLYGFRSYARLSESRPSFESMVGNVKPGSAIGIRFAFPVKIDRFISGIRISPAAEVSFQWVDENTKLRIVPDSSWVPGTHYRISLPEGKTIWFGKIPATELSFDTWELPHIASVFPTNGMKDVLLGAEDPVIVRLDRPAKDAFLSFSFNGIEAELYGISPGREEFRILPKDLSPGARYRLTVRARHREAGDDSLETIYDGSFETLPPAPTEWARDFATRLAEAKRYTKPVLSEGKYIDINVASQVMVIFENGQAIDSFLVSSGKRGMDTPQGEFAIRNKTTRAWSKAYGLYMPYWMALVPDGKFGIHELPEWPGGYKEGAAHLGTPVSHGCVRLGVGSAKRVYEWADIGTSVVVHR